MGDVPRRNRKNMSFSTCKYDRELQFIWSRLNFLRKNLDAGKEVDGKSREEMINDVEELTERQRGIEITYMESEMAEYLIEIKAKHNAPPIDLDAPSDEPAIGKDLSHLSDDPMEQVASINQEILELENELVKAEIECDDKKCQKIGMSIASLKSRRTDIVERMKSQREEATKEPEASAIVSDIDVNEMIKDLASLRTQLGVLRSEVMDLRGELAQLGDRLGIDRF